MFAQLLDFIISNMSCVYFAYLIEKSLQYFGQYLKASVMLQLTQIPLKIS